MARLSPGQSTGASRQLTSFVQHFHSMETFSHFEILDFSGERKVEGHKASFCLEDNHCQGAEPRYDCENYGEQGITAGCQDIYYNNIDCQWIDITELDVGKKYT